MNLNNHYCYFKSALPPRLCDDIIKYGLSHKETLGKTGYFDNKKLSKNDVNDLKRKRNSNIVWLNDPWIYKELQPYIHKANKTAGWNFQWDMSDSWSKPYEQEGPQKGKIRKLSMTCQLTDGSEYEGGELEFDYRNYDPHMRNEAKHLKQVKEILSKGSIIVFPSFVWHRVKPVTKGTRYSIVMWNLGYPFK